MGNLYWKIPITVILVLLSGSFSGLTLGFMGLDLTQLKVLSSAETEDPETRNIARYAARIIPIRSEGNLLLCTLVIANVAVNSAISILLAGFTDGLMGFVLSTVLIVLFGEILPQAVCSRYGLYIGAKVVPLVKALIWLEFVIAKPISLLLDKVVGEDLGTVLNKPQMKSFFQFYEKESLLHTLQKRILTSTLDFYDREVAEIVTPLERTYMLDGASEFNVQLMHEISEMGFSRIPVYQTTRDNVIGVLLTKDLMFLTEDKARSLWGLKSLFLHQVPEISPKDSLGQTMKTFQSSNSHLAIVSQIQGDTKRVLGVLTMEDVIEALLQQEIKDEHDLQRASSIQLNTSLSEKAQLSTARTVLSAQCIREIVSFLRKNLGPFHSEKIAKSQLKELLRESQVISLSGEEENLHSRGLTSPFFYLVLKGKMHVLRSSPEVLYASGPLKYIGLGVLENPHECFIADYTATAGSPAELLRIHRELYLHYARAD